MADYVLKTKAPSLPIAPNSYSQDYVNQLTNSLRLYFNTLDAANGQTIQQINSLNVMNWLGEM